MPLTLSHIRELIASTIPGPALRLVWYDIDLLSLFIPDGVFFKQRNSFLCLAKESIVHEQVEERV